MANDIDKLIGRIKATVELATQQLQFNMAEACDKGITDPVWDWPRKTIRSDGKAVGSPRDIVDTGMLKESVEINPVENFWPFFNFTITWDPKNPFSYGSAVHDGFEVEYTDDDGESGIYTYPARPWTYYAIPKDQRKPVEIENGYEVSEIEWDIILDKFTTTIRNGF